MGMNVEGMKELYRKKWKVKRKWRKEKRQGMKKAKVRRRQEVNNNT